MNNESNDKNILKARNKKKMSGIIKYFLKTSPKDLQINYIDK